MVIQDSKKGIKEFIALQDYYVHLQMRTIETFPVVTIIYINR